jgi:hypothetical protein
MTLGDMIRLAILQDLAARRTLTTDERRQLAILLTRK